MYRNFIISEHNCGIGDKCIYIVQTRYICYNDFKEARFILDFLIR